jgi:glycosyltransferase involved in cell wall biosynthesis
MADPLVVLLATLGDPGQLTGGYLYHQRLADLAPAHDARIGFVSVPEGPFPLPALAARRLVHAILDEDPDALVVDSIVAAYLAPAVRRLARIPLLASIHQPPGGMDHGPLRVRVQARFDLFVYRQIPALLVASQYLADQFVLHGFARRRLHVVPPGRDVVVGADATDPPGARNGPTTASLRQGRAAAFLCVANWIPRKGILALLDAFALLPAEAGTLHFAGQTDVDPQYAARVRERLAEPGLRERVVVHGPLRLDEVAALYAAADVFVLPSTQEPFGTVYGEAMAMGLPVVGVAAGNLPHLATDGEEGRIVPIGHPEALAAALAELADDEPLRRRLGEAARRRALKRPTWEETAALFFGLVRQSVDQHVS